MEALIQSFFLVAVTEMGDKTQLLAFVLASRFKKPWTIMGGIIVATIANHLLAATVGTSFGTWLSPDRLRYLLAICFIGFAIWVLIPDKDDEKEREHPYGAFVTTVLTFFLAEMGDKTQLSTVALAAKFQNIWVVTAGTTLGMIFSDGLAVFLGEEITKFVSMKWIRIIAAMSYFGMAAWLVIHGI
jgi:Ca2+/H+ antiporter, TMEM165/GDT1 family